MSVFLYTEYSLHIPLSQLFTFYKNLYFFGGGICLCNDEKRGIYEKNRYSQSYSSGV